MTNENPTPRKRGRPPLPARPPHLKRLRYDLTLEEETAEWGKAQDDSGLSGFVRKLLRSAYEKARKPSDLVIMDYELIEDIPKGGKNPTLEPLIVNVRRNADGTRTILAADDDHEKTLVAEARARRAKRDRDAVPAQTPAKSRRAP